MHRAISLSLMSIVMALGLVSSVGVSGASATAPGCYSGQVGLYNQANYNGPCYGFSGRNNSFDQWPGIKNKMRSQWNGGTSGLAAYVWAYNNQTGSYLCTRWNEKKSWGSNQRAQSNNWPTNNC